MSKIEPKIQAYQVACLSLLAMLIKLLRRKQRGKRLFSEAFEYERRMKMLEESYHRLEHAIDEKREDVSLVEVLPLFSSMAFDATKEVKMESLKDDYFFLGDSLVLLQQHLSR